MRLDLRKIKCPKCGKKTMSYRDHPSAFGYKDYTRVRCRSCRATFRVKIKGLED